MNTVRIAIAYLLFLIAAKAQEARSYSVYLTAKENVQQLQHPHQFLSERSLLRREKQNIRVKRSDLPVSTERLQTIDNIVTYKGPQSKWLNAVYVEATAEELVALTELSL